MRIDAFANDQQILAELGARLRACRVRAGFTQERLSKESGVAKSTVERTEKGQSVQLESLIKLLRALSRVSGLDLLLPGAEPTPYEIVNKREPKCRVRDSGKARPKQFKWGDEL